MLNKYLKKLGLNSFSELNTEEKETFREWEIALSGRKLTNKDVKAWLDLELDTAITRLTEEDISKEADRFRKVEVRMIKKIINFLDSPKVEKAFVEKSIEQLMK